ncbi:hypothetical protein KFL_000030060 [Klebsormidium nitens]|uniref:2-oxoadipate dioxygenase/decarboxylase n=1 Tax=Klebsormidium nitens TaxID=105231 RepID=A0A1Y1HM95_KLENI|nr:hypothetical protein KFL_000030060 [Klebsormidium nitens]|eukprot:GAQ77726.1 hypothetical protein KFL_000030060 [Klebsormidium nitens]
METLFTRTPAVLSMSLQATLGGGGTERLHRYFFAPSNIQGGQTAPQLTSSSFTGTPVQLPKAFAREKGHAVSETRRGCSMEAKAPLKTPGGEVADCETAHPLLRKILKGMLKPYVKRNPTAAQVMSILGERELIRFDHFAFRTFGVEGYGIDSIAKMFLDLGYRQRDELRFPAKKLRAYWYSPPKEAVEESGASMTDGPLPRVFISELLVDQLSEKAQAIIKKYTSEGRQLAGHAALSSLVHGLPWRTPELKDYVELTRESEYAAWTLVNGYALNHTTITCHDFVNFTMGPGMALRDVVNFLYREQIALNGAGGSLINVSPDKLLLQASTEADIAPFTFAGGHVADVPLSYIEFAHREVLPEFENLPLEEIYDCHRREGFEVGNADNIFESTSIKRSHATT